MKMKKVLFLCLLGFAFSCKETLTKHPSIRRIVNETGVDVRVEVFGDEANKFIYDIASLDSLDIEGFCTSGIETYCDLGWVTSLPFGNIFFDEERVLSFESGDGSSNAINSNPLGGNGYIKSKENGVGIYTYRITQEDYENAEPIGG